MRPGLLILMLFALLFLSSCYKLDPQSELSNIKLNLIVTSTDFRQYEAIPQQFSCEGQNTNPLLIIKGIPKTAKALVIIVEDFDAPSGDFVHWIGYSKVNDNQILISQNSHLDVEGINDFGKKGYAGPCPPSGQRHRYHFKAYALDNLPNIKTFTKKILMKQIKSHIVAEGELIGEYER
jgi:Raf kinase inhibitor-like YbhB/YbcL family protein